MVSVELGPRQCECRSSVCQPEHVACASLTDMEAMKTPAPASISDTGNASLKVGWSKSGLTWGRPPHQTDASCRSPRWSDLQGSCTSGAPVGCQKPCRPHPCGDTQGNMPTGHKPSMSSSPSAQSLWGGACPLWGTEFAFCSRVSGYWYGIQALTAQEASYREEAHRFPVHGLYPWGPWVLPWDGGTGMATVGTKRERHSFLDRDPLPPCGFSSGVDPAQPALRTRPCPELSLAVPAGGDGSECIPEWLR